MKLASIVLGLGLFVAEDEHLTCSLPNFNDATDTR
jgi:hypothetical protein